MVDDLLIIKVDHKNINDFLEEYKTHEFIKTINLTVNKLVRHNEFSLKQIGKDFFEKSIDKLENVINKEVRKKLNKYLAQITNSENNINNIKSNINLINSKIKNVETQIEQFKIEINNLNEAHDQFKEKELKFVTDVGFNISENDDNVDEDELFAETLFRSKKIKTKFDFTYYLESSDYGTAAQIFRWRDACVNSLRGFYKNPYLMKSIKNYNFQINITDSIDTDIRDKYSLNAKQIEAVEKVMNTDSVFYLQGPPGTGKTQTLCAVSEHIIKNNEKLVMTSSTHEAIHNFFDRLKLETSTEPDFILLKYNRKVKGHANDLIENHSEKSLYYEFFNKAINYVQSRDYIF